MALPQLKSTETKKIESNIDQIKKELPILKKQPQTIIKMEDFRKNKSVFEKTSKPPAPKTSIEKVSAANEKAIERSRKVENPLVPLMTTMSSSLFTIERILKDILNVLEKQSDRLSNSMENSGGLSASDFGDWNRGRKKKRTRTGRTRGPSSRTSRVVKSGLKGAAGLAGALGLGYLASKLGIDDDTQTAVGTGANLASDVIARKAAPTAVEAAAGGARAGVGAAEAAAGGSKVLGAFGKVASRVLGAPLAAGLSVYENYDELASNGKVDPLNQIKKAGSGLADVFDVTDNLFSMKRLNGALDVMSGATGAVLGARHSGGFRYS